MVTVPKLTVEQIEGLMASERKRASLALPGGVYVTRVKKGRKHFLTIRVDRDIILSGKAGGTSEAQE